MKIYDCFTFFNELDILEIRLAYLYKYVDYFVLVESDRTHSGNPKPYYFEENKSRFQKFSNKIIHIKHHLEFEETKTMEFSSEYNPKDEFWKLENEQRLAIHKGLNNLNPNDVVILSDVDEIPSSDILKKINSILFWHKKITLVQDLHLYFINCVATGGDRKWPGSVITRYKNLATVQDLRDNRYRYKKIQKGGWHFSYMGGLDSIVHKIKSFAHTEFNRQEFLDKESLIKKIRSGKDIYNREGHATHLSKGIPENIPSGLGSILVNYPSFLLD